MSTLALPSLTPLVTSIICSVRYSDTSGLYNFVNYELSALVISDVLRLGSAFKLVVVITFDAGHLNPNDLTATRTVLQAVESIICDSAKKHFTIVNKCDTSRAWWKTN